MPRNSRHTWSQGAMLRNEIIVEFRGSILRNPKSHYAPRWRGPCRREALPSLTRTCREWRGGDSDVGSRADVRGAARRREWRERRERRELPTGAEGAAEAAGSERVERRERSERRERAAGAEGTSSMDGRDIVHLSVKRFDRKRIIRNKKHWCSSMD
jgi:hypothetical protein